MISTRKTHFIIKYKYDKNIKTNFIINYIYDAPDKRTSCCKTKHCEYTIQVTHGCWCQSVFKVTLGSILDKGQGHSTLKILMKSEQKQILKITKVFFFYIYFLIKKLIINFYIDDSKKNPNRSYTLTSTWLFFSFYNKNS